METKNCINCKKSFIADYYWRVFCADCLPTNSLCGRIYPKYRAMQILTGKDIPACEKCGIDDIRVLTINHVHSKPSKAEQSTNLYHKIIEADRAKKENGLIIMDLKRFNVLCHNCNWIYEYEKERFTFPTNEVFSKYVNIRNKQPMKTYAGRGLPISRSLGNINCQHKNVPTYAAGKCYTCYKEPRNREYYQKNKERFRQYHKEYYQKKKQQKEISKLG